MATTKSAEVFECSECDHREENLDSFKTTIFICNNCDSEYHDLEDAAVCCDIEEGEEDEEDDDDLIDE